MILTVLGITGYGDARHGQRAGHDPTAYPRARRYGPHTEVQFSYEGGKVWLTRAEADTRSSSRGQSLVERLRGTATANLDLTTDEIMTMTRGED